MRTLATVLFPDFELLDVYGPLEMFGMAKDDIEVRMVAETADPVQGRGGPRTAIDDVIADDHDYDILLIPGGFGTRDLLENDNVLDWVRRKSKTAELVTSVCTGSTLLSAAGVLDGRKATTNKMSYAWATSFGPNVNWQKQARWVRDGKFVTSSGVSAGMDMSLAVIAELLGEETAEKFAVAAEYEWQRDATRDAFAKIHGLV
jgi:transcriptional regulator GlxA family with amidase domain